MYRRELLATAICLFLIIALAGCSKQTSSFDANSDYDTIQSQAAGQTVTFYGWGGDDQLNQWLDTTIAPELKEKYNITFERVSMDIDQILNKLSGEKQANKQDGSIDIIWINGENFYSAKQNNLLFGPITQYMPNFSAYIDSQDMETQYDFGHPIEGFEAPFGKSQFILIYDENITLNPPKNAQELLEFAKANPGQITYPALPDFTGSAFVRTLLYDIVGYEALNNCAADKQAVREVMEPGITYLRELNQYLWNEGRTFPATYAQFDNMYKDGELIMSMNYGAYYVAAQIEKGAYTNTSRSFLLDNGTVGNAHYLAIAYNSTNKQAAIVAINELLSPHMQKSKLEDAKYQPSIDYRLLSQDDQKAYDNVTLGEGVLPESELVSHRLPELPAAIVSIIEEIWLEEVVGK